MDCGFHVFFHTNQPPPPPAMGVISRMIKSAFSSAAAASSRRRMSSFSIHKRNDLFLVSGFTHETETHYFSLISTENWATVRDFHSPYFGGWDVSMSGCNNEERIWNPWTNEFKLLPPSYVPRRPNKYSYSFSKVGFGFDSECRDYKVLRLVDNYLGDCFGHHIEFQIELYSLKNDSWKEIFADPGCPYFTASDYLDRQNPSYANGRCYWETENKSILSFDFASESFSCFPLPETHHHSRCELVELDGLLGLIAYSKSWLDVELWVRNEESWIRKYEIHVAGKGNVGLPLGLFSSDHNRLLFLRGIEGHVELMLKTVAVAQLLVYEVDTEDVKKFDIYDYSPNCDMRVYPCFDTNLDFNGT